MFAFIAGLVAAIPTFDKWFTAIVAEYQNIQAAKAKAAAAAKEASIDNSFKPLVNGEATDADRQAAAQAVEDSLSSSNP